MINGNVNFQYRYVKYATSYWCNPKLTSTKLWKDIYKDKNQQHVVFRCSASDLLSLYYQLIFILTITQNIIYLVSNFIIVNDLFPASALSLMIAMHVLAPLKIMMDINIAQFPQLATSINTLGLAYVTTRSPHHIKTTNVKLRCVRVNNKLKSQSSEAHCLYAILNLKKAKRQLTEKFTKNETLEVAMSSYSTLIPKFHSVILFTFIFHHFNGILRSTTI